MSQNNSNRSFFGKIYRSWIVRITALLLLLGGLGYLFLPQPVRNTLTVDRQHTWERETPLGREFAWQPPQQLPLPPRQTSDDSPLKDSLIRPLLADDGQTLYLTVRDRQGAADIYSASKTKDGWTAPQPVAALNTEADDIGPVLSRDGQELYLYSDRQGGLGGFDLYVSKRTEAGWSTPENLGPAVNSAAHEYDPAIAPNGQQLFFSSNRTAQMQQRTKEFEGKHAEWTETLRARQGLLQFDLYACRRDQPNQPWQAAAGLEKLNRNDANEGAPYVAGNGVFLYFASDRPHTGKQRNYDIYRARIDRDQFAQVENLGAGVNTPANETEPYVTASEMQLVFSSDRLREGAEGDQEDVYALYASNAQEVFHEVAWAPGAAASMPWSDILFWAVFALLLIGLLAGLIWYLRQVSLRRAPVPAFFLIALIVHLLLASGMFFVAMNQELAERVRKELSEIVALDYAEDHPSDEPQQSNFDKVSELDTVEDVQPVEVARQEASTPDSTPLPSQEMLDTAISAEMARDLPPEQVVFVPLPTPTTSTASPFARRQIEVTMSQESAIALEQTAAEESQLAETQQAQVDLTRNETVPDTAAPAPAMTAPSTNEVPLEREAVEPEQVALAAPSSQPQAMQLARRRAAPAETAVLDTEPIEQVAAESATASESPATQAAKIAVMKASAVAPSEAPQTLAETAGQAIAEARPIALASARPALSTPLPLTRSMAQTPITRAARIPADVAGAAAPIEQADLPSETAGSPSSVETVKVALLKASDPGASAPSELAERMAADPSEKKPGAASLSPADRTSDLAGLPATAGAQSPLQRRGPAAAAVAGATTATEQLAAAGSASPQLTAGAAGVVLQKQASGESAKAMQQTLAQRAVSLAGPAALEHVERAAAAGNPAPAPASTMELQIARKKAAAEKNAPAGEAIETLALAMATTPGAAAPSATAQVGVERREAVSPGESPAPAGRTAEGADPANDSLDLGALSRRPLPLGAQLASNTLAPSRRGPLAARFNFAEGAIGLQAMFRMRRGDAKKDVVEAFGGNDRTLAAVRRGLVWFQVHQFKDGSWSLHEFDRECAPQHRSGGFGTSRSDVAATGFALLPFLGDGHTHLEGEYKTTVERGLAWLVAGQKEDGELTRGNEGNARMYSHGIATIALCEAYGMSKDPQLREPAQKAIDFIVKSQHQASGGWRYAPNQPGDTSVFGWQIMALKSGQMANLQVPEATLNNARRWLTAVGGKGANLGTFGYTSPSASRAMTAEGLLCLEYLGAEKLDPRVQQGADYLAKHLPAPNKENSYYWYYGTQVMFHLQGSHWQQWNESMRDMLLDSQIVAGASAGTWNPKDTYEKSGGRIYTTALRLLMLEVYHRHLPLYQILDE